MCIIHKRGGNMRSDAQKKADKKYIESGKCKYKTIGTRLNIEQAQRIEKAANKAGLSISKFLLKSALYCIENNIDLKE